MKDSANSDQLSLSLGDSCRLSLPGLEAPEQRKPIWSISHRVLAISEEVTTGSRREWEDGKDIGESLATKSGGRYLLLKRGAKCPVTLGENTGILRIKEDGKPGDWLNHAALEQYQSDVRGDLSVRRERAAASWRNALSFAEESKTERGLRRPQIGALHAIGAHWSLTREPALIVMPTGTGKTETMLATMVAYGCACILVVTPSTAVRDQVADKFRTLGKLKEFGLVSPGSLHPVVGVIKRRPRKAEDLEVFRRCNVVVSTVSAIAQGTAEKLVPEIAKLCSHLFIDEAHHVAARSWNFLKSSFTGKPVLQFTATPFREDGGRIEGKPIYSYPLATAQREGYFKHINFAGIFEEHEDREDEAIAAKAISILRDDLKKGCDHLLMARCSSKKRANQLIAIYSRLAPDLNPIVIHSEIQKARAKTNSLFKRESRIVVCVNMLAEGFDLPNLKVAAVHDKHKSLAVLLQFVGRFTRTASPKEKINDATVVANIADPEVAEALRSLYVEDADWDQLLADVSMERLEREKRISDFLRSAKDFRLDDDKARLKVSLATIRPKQSAVVYEADQFIPEKFIDSLKETDGLEDAWIFEEHRMVVTVHRLRERVLWTRNRRIEDELWELRVAYFNRDKKLLFVHGSDPDNLYGDLALAVTAKSAQRMEGGDCFRVFGGINRLTLHQVGIKRQSARRAVSYTQHSGSDVKQGLTSAEQENSRKAMISGTGFEYGARVAAGASRKGKVWARQAGLLIEFRDWCDRVAEKIRDAGIDPEEVIRDGLKSEELTAVPDLTVLRIEWGERFQSHADGNASLTIAGTEIGLYECDICLKDRRSDGSLEFAVVSMYGAECSWLYEINKSGFKISLLGDKDPAVHRGKRSQSLTDWFQEDPPAVLFVDGSEMIGAEIFRPKKFGGEFREEQLCDMNWGDTIITEESLWKEGVERPKSVQAWAIAKCKSDGFDFIFNDDDAGEIADIVCFKKTDAGFVVRFVHCKFSKEANPGGRAVDVTEVASQAARSVSWTGHFTDLVKQIKRRSRKLNGKHTRYVDCDASFLNRYERLATAVSPSYEIVVAQPGVSKSKVTADQRTILSAADGYLRQTVEVPLTVWCSV